MLQTILYASLIFVSTIGSAQTQIALDMRGTLCKGGSGVCNPDRNPPKDSTMKMYTTTKLDFNKMSFEIDPINLAIEDQIRFFGKEYRELKPTDEIVFIQENDFIFDLDTLIYLDLDLAYGLLKKGTYPVTIEKEKVKVTFTLSFHR
jgi:hypothetical protein